MDDGTPLTNNWSKSIRPVFFNLKVHCTDETQLGRNSEYSCMICTCKYVCICIPLA